MRSTATLADNPIMSNERGLLYEYPQSGAHRIRTGLRNLDQCHSQASLLKMTFSALGTAFLTATVLIRPNHKEL